MRDNITHIQTHIIHLNIALNGLITDAYYTLCHSIYTHCPQCPILVLVFLCAHIFSRKLNFTHTHTHTRTPNHSVYIFFFCCSFVLLLFTFHAIRLLVGRIFMQFVEFNVEFVQLSHQTWIATMKMHSRATIRSDFCINKMNFCNKFTISRNTFHAQVNSVRLSIWLFLTLSLRFDSTISTLHGKVYRLRYILFVMQLRHRKYTYISICEHRAKVPSRMNTDTDTNQHTHTHIQPQPQ